MVERPRIGVTGDHRRWSPSWWCLSALLRVMGAQPSRISIHEPRLGQEFDGLVVSGGHDISPKLYGGEEDPASAVDSQRDALEASWIRRALKRDWPVLGICRGAQLLNVVLGGTLIQDVTSQRRQTSNRSSVLPTKTVQVDQGSSIAQSIGCAKIRVNSLHRQAIHTPGEQLSVVGRDRDSLCQAIETTQGASVIGVQWHPEYLFYMPAQRRLFQWLIDSAARNG